MSKYRFISQEVVACTLFAFAPLSAFLRAERNKPVHFSVFVSRVVRPAFARYLAIPGDGKCRRTIEARILRHYKSLGTVDMYSLTRMGRFYSLMADLFTTYPCDG